MFSQVCVIPSVHGWGISFPACITGHMTGGPASGGVCIQRGGLGTPRPLDTTDYGQRAGRTHPTGIHSCFVVVFLILNPGDMFTHKHKLLSDFLPTCFLLKVVLTCFLRTLEASLVLIMAVSNSLFGD